MGRLEIARSFADSTSPPEPPTIYDVELEDPHPLREYLHNISMQMGEQNLKVWGVVFPARSYFSIVEYVREFSTRCDDQLSEPGTLSFDGIRLFMDPMRDTGEPLPLFDDENAVTIYTMRLKAAKSAATKGDE